VTSYDIYARISQEGDRSPAEVAEQLAIYEADCRRCAEREGLAVELVVTETDVSGAKPVDERELGELIRRVEDGLSAGIIVPDVERFGRDTLEGALAWRRIELAGGRLIGANDGLDSAKPSAKLYFDMKTAFADDLRRRMRANFLARNQRAAKGGAYLACKPPVGYVRDHESGRITPHPKLKRLIQQAFERRAAGETAKSIAAWLRETGGSIEVPNPKKPRNRKPGEPETVFPLAGITEEGVRHLLASRAYLGEARVQSDRKGDPDVIQNAHPAVVTPETWERAQAAGGPYRPNDGSLASTVRLSGLCRCPNGHRLKVGGRGKNRPAGNAAYVCTRPDCDARVGIAAAALDDHVAYMLTSAVVAGEPHVTAVLAGDDRYERALDAVEQAQVELDTYRAEVKISDVGRDAWLADVATRQAALDLAREALRSIPAPAPRRIGKPGREMTFAAALPGLEREHFARFIDRVVVLPVGKGVRKPVGTRVEVWWVGADGAAEYVEPTSAVPVAPENPLAVAA
jgi:DNA invertase Pin-like site-specific DNA recombinase